MLASCLRQRIQVPGAKKRGTPNGLYHHHDVVVYQRKGRLSTAFTRSHRITFASAAVGGTRSRPDFVSVGLLLPPSSPGSASISAAAAAAAACFARLCTGAAALGGVRASAAAILVVVAGGKAAVAAEVAPPAAATACRVRLPSTHCVVQDGLQASFDLGGATPSRPGGSNLTRVVVSCRVRAFLSGGLEEHVRRLRRQELPVLLAQGLGVGDALSRLELFLRAVPLDAQVGGGESRKDRVIGSETKQSGGYRRSF